jgi:distribution and morphology protein 12
MSIDLNWSTLTSGPDGEALEASIRDFIHTKFQSVPLPRFIKSVKVHDFSFGSVPPELELKDITDPLPDFYEQSDSEPGSGSDTDDDDEGEHAHHRGDEDEELLPEEIKRAAERRRQRAVAASASASGHPHHHHPHPEHINLPGRGIVGGRGPPLPDLGSQVPMQSPMFFGAAGALLTPGIPGGTTNMHYFHSQFASGTQTPLLAAAAASAAATGGGKGSGGGYGFGLVGGGEGMHHSSSSPELWAQGVGSGAGRGHARQASSGSLLSVGDDEMVPVHGLREKHSVSTLAPTSAGTSRPPTRENLGDGADEGDDDDEEDERGTDRTPGQGGDEEGGKPRMREARVEDMQAVFRIRYAGDVKLLLTADILLDYPMPSFVGIPVRLSITGLTFDGVGVLAKIRKRAHFCFLSPEDAVAAVGGEENKEEVEGGERRHAAAAAAGSGSAKSTKMGGLLQEIRVESEIGQREGGKQSLKNVGKVERFVLEQVRRIFEEEFVYPSFWTFLV